MTLYFERLWPRLWLILGVAGLFLLVSLAERLGAPASDPAHSWCSPASRSPRLAALIYAARVPYPGREEAVRRIERASGMPHRPASSYEDTITANAEDPRTAPSGRRTVPASPPPCASPRRAAASARRPRRPHRAARAALLGVVARLALVGDSAADRLRSAFRFNSRSRISEARLDAWVTPPPTPAAAVDARRRRARPRVRRSSAEARRSART